MQSVATPNEDKLLESLVWSNIAFSLAEFVEKYELPQVVCVEDGYFGETEDSELSSGQILTLHSLQHTTKVVCKTQCSDIVLIPLHCPLKFRVHPVDCEHTSVTANQLSTVYRHIKYLRVVQGHQNEMHRPEESCKADDILKVKSFHSAKGLMKCTNMFTKQDVFVPYDCDALFAPLLDYRAYTLAEVKREFGFPAKVRWLDTKGTVELSAASGQGASSMSVSSLGEITAYDEIEDSIVISTTMCGSMHTKLCMRIPKDLKIRVVVAEGFMSGDETYQRVVRTLDKGLNKTCLKDFENLDVYQHLDSVRKGIQNVMSPSCSVEKASEKAQQLVRKHRSKDPVGPSPKLPPRKPPPPINADSTSRPPIPPKSRPKPLGDLPPTPKSAKMLERLKSLNRMKPWLTTFHEKITKSEDGHSEYAEATSKPADAVAYETPEGEYTELDRSDKSPENIYKKHLLPTDKPVKAAPLSPPPQLPVSNTHEIFQALAQIPQDISGLSTRDVSRILGYLGMDCCVNRFQQELVDGVMLQEMNEDCLKSLGVNSFHSMKLMKFVRGWRPKEL